MNQGYCCCKVRIVMIFITLHMWACTLNKTPHPSKFVTLSHAYVGMVKCSVNYNSASFIMRFITVTPDPHLTRRIHRCCHYIIWLVMHVQTCMPIFVTMYGLMNDIEQYCKHQHIIMRTIIHNYYMHMHRRISEGTGN